MAGRDTLIRSKTVLNCRRYERQMSDFLDNLLSRANEDALRFHLNGCPRCRLKMEDMERAIRAVKSLPSLTPKPEFDHQVGSILTEEIARDLYTVSWRQRFSDGYADLVELSQQRPIRLVFATSLILTITLFGGLMALIDSSEQASLELVPSITVSPPTRFEPEHASPVPLSPLPLEHELAPRMAIKPLHNAVPISKFASSTALNPLLIKSRPTIETPGIKTVRTMEPTTYEMRMVSAGTSLRLAPSLFAEPFGQDLNTSNRIDQQLTTKERVQSVGNGKMPDVHHFTNPSAPLRHIRISF